MGLESGHNLSALSQEPPCFGDFGLEIKAKLTDNEEVVLNSVSQD
jgi:hypothetical protein